MTTRVKAGTYMVYEKGLIGTLTMKRIMPRSAFYSYTGNQDFLNDWIYARTWYTSRRRPLYLRRYRKTRLDDELTLGSDVYGITHHRNEPFPDPL